MLTRIELAVVTGLILISLRTQVTAQEYGIGHGHGLGSHGFKLAKPLGNIPPPVPPPCLPQGRETCCQSELSPSKSPDVACKSPNLDTLSTFLISELPNLANLSSIYYQAEIQRKADIRKQFGPVLWEFTPILMGAPSNPPVDKNTGIIQKLRLRCEGQGQSQVKGQGHLEFLQQTLLSGLKDVSITHCTIPQITHRSFGSLPAPRSKPETCQQQNEDSLYLIKNRRLGDLCLKSVNLNSNDIEKVEPRVFADRGQFMGVNSLSLDNNRIQVLEDGTFDGLFALGILSLSGNKGLSRIEPRAFAQSPGLTHLDLSGNALTQLPMDALRFTPALNYLNLDGNRIRHLTSSPFLDLPDLTFLSLGHNKLKSIPLDFLKMFPSLSTLKLNHNKLQEDSEYTLQNFQSDLTSGQKLEKLDLSHNRLKGLTSFTGLRKLFELDLSHNDLRGALTLAEVIPKGLYRLDLSHNRLTELWTTTDLKSGRDNEIGNNRNIGVDLDLDLDLRVLIIVHNKLTSLGPWSLPKRLAYLWASDNLIEYIAPWTFHGLEDLTDIFMHNNRLATLSAPALCLHPRIEPSLTLRRRKAEEIDAVNLYLHGNPYECRCGQSNLDSDSETYWLPTACTMTMAMDMDQERDKENRDPDPNSVLEIQSSYCRLPNLNDCIDPNRSGQSPMTGPQWTAMSQMSSLVTTNTSLLDVATSFQFSKFSISTDIVA